MQRSPVLDSIRIIFFQIALWLRPTLSPHLLTNPSPALEVKLVPGKGGSDSLVRVTARNLACPGYYGGGDLGSYGDLIGCFAKILRICPQWLSVGRNHGSWVARCPAVWRIADHTPAFKVNLGAADAVKSPRMSLISDPCFFASLT